MQSKPGSVEANGTPEAVKLLEEVLLANGFKKEKTKPDAVMELVMKLMHGEPCPFLLYTRGAAIPNIFFKCCEAISVRKVRNNDGTVDVVYALLGRATMLSPPEGKYFLGGRFYADSGEPAVYQNSHRIQRLIIRQEILV